MENITLADLAKVINEEIYFFPEDRESVSVETSEESVPAPKDEAASSSVEIPIKNESNEKIDEVQEPKKELIQVSGSFNQGILILHEEEELNADIMNLLSKIINAVNHSMNDVGLVSSSKLSGRSLDDLYDLNAHKIIKFGRIRHGIDALPAPDYQVYTEDETEFLFADALSIIFEDEALKRKLWKALQILFTVTK